MSESFPTRIVVQMLEKHLNRLSCNDRECYWYESTGYCTLTCNSYCWECSWCSRSNSFGVLSVG